MHLKQGVTVAASKLDLDITLYEADDAEVTAMEAVAPSPLSSLFINRTF